MPHQIPIFGTRRRPVAIPTNGPSSGQQIAAAGGGGRIFNRVIASGDFSEQQIPMTSGKRSRGSGTSEQDLGPIPMPAPTRAQRREGARQRTRESYERVRQGAFARNAQTPGTPAYAQREVAHEDAAAGLIPYPTAATSTRGGGRTFNNVISPYDDARATAARAQAYRELRGGELAEPLPDDEARDLAGLPRRQPTTQPATPAPAAGQPATRPTTQPVGGKRDIGMSTQIGRQMFAVLGKENPGVPIGQLREQFVAKMSEYGADGGAMFDAWSKDGSLGQRDFPQPGPQRTAPAQARIDIPFGNGRGGTATLPSGEQVVLSATGQRVGAPIGQGAPLGPIPLPPQMGPEQGFTPAPRLPMNDATGGLAAHDPRQALQIPQSMIGARPTPPTRADQRAAAVNGGAGRAQPTSQPIPPPRLPATSQQPPQQGQPIAVPSEMPETPMSGGVPVPGNVLSTRTARALGQQQQAAPSGDAGGLPRVSPAAGAMATGAPAVRTKAEYDALPSGADYIDARTNTRKRKQ